MTSNTPMFPRGSRRLAASLLALLLTTPPLLAQEQTTTTPPRRADAAAPTEAEVARAAREARNDEVVTLTPFQVDTTKDQGYFAQNTLAGSRMRTNIADLGASITVITAQQFEDTASTDINDIFRYEANTEGSYSYTPAIQSLRNDGVIDVSAGFTHGGDGQPQTNAIANRVRGIGIPSASYNYYPAISQVPFDAYNVQSIEISRGPNSMLFGMGSPAGIVNQSSTQAVLNRESYTLQLRTDHNGSFRSSFSFNQGLVDDKLAFAGAVLVDNKEFERQPSYDDTRRYYGALTFKPFSKTILRANVEKYDNKNRRPNTLTPRDSVTEWRRAGSPSYDPVTGVITRNGQYAGTLSLRNDNLPFLNETRAYIESLPDYDASKWNGARTAYNGVNIFGGGALTDARSALYTPGLSLATVNRPLQQIHNGQVVNWFVPEVVQYRQVFGTATNPAANAPLYPAVADILADPLNAQAFNNTWTKSAFWTATGNGVGSYRYPGVSDRSIYDWENINILQMNFGRDRNMTYNLELEQEILPSLNFSAGWFRQDFESVTNYTVSQVNVATLFVDTNVRLPDGRPNPYFGLPYVEDQDPDRFFNDELNDNYRAMLAWTPDFTRNSNWSRWLGRHQILGLGARNDTERTLIRQRMFITNSSAAADGTIMQWIANPNNNADGSPTGWNRQQRSALRTYYLANPGDPANGAVTRASGVNQSANSHTGQVQIYNFDTRSWNGMNMTHEYIDMDASLLRTQRVVDSLSFGATSHFWNDRLVTTFGVRKDKYKARGTTAGAILDGPGGNQVAPGMTNPQKWVNGVLQTDTMLNRWNYWDRLEGTTRTLGGVLRPFHNWNRIETQAANGSQWHQFVSSLGFSYNKSDNFNPPSAAQVDGFGAPLPKPTGEGQDWGVQFSLLDNKLFARVNWFKSTNENERTNPGTSISRLWDNVDTQQFRNWARTITLINMGHDPRLNDFGVGLTQAEEQAVQDASAQIWGLPYTYYQDIGSIYATRDAEAEGVEVQITYNPTRNWTMKFTAGQQETKYTNVLKEFDAWYAERNSVWSAARAANHLLPQYQHFASYTRDNGREVNLTDFWSSYGYTSQAFIGEANGYENQQLYYDGVVTPQYAIARDLNGQAAPGQRKYRWSFLSNYSFDEGRLRGVSVGGNLRWEDKAVIGYHGKVNPGSGSTDLTLSDTTRPIYDSANYYTDLWVSYSRRILNDRVNMKIQLNVGNVFESGGLRVVGVNYDGSPNAYRIIDSRQFVLSTKFDF